MKYDEMIKHVQSVSQMEDRVAAEKAIQATLQILSKRILGDEASNLAAQLPQEAGRHLMGREGQSSSSFSLGEFYEQVAQAEGVDEVTAANHVRSVFMVLNIAVNPQEFEDIKANLSDDYEELFSATAASNRQKNQ